MMVSRDIATMLVSGLNNQIEQYNLDPSPTNTNLIIKSFERMYGMLKYYYNNNAIPSSMTGVNKTAREIPLRCDKSDLLHILRDPLCLLELFKEVKMPIKGTILDDSRFIQALYNFLWIILQQQDI